MGGIAVPPELSVVVPSPVLPVVVPEPVALPEPVPVSPLPLLAPVPPLAPEVAEPLVPDAVSPVVGGIMGATVVPSVVPEAMGGIVGTAVSPSSPLHADDAASMAATTDRCMSAGPGGRGVSFSLPSSDAATGSRSPGAGEASTSYERCVAKSAHWADFPDR